MGDEASSTITDCLARLAGGVSLSRAESQQAMAALLAGTATPGQIGAFLMGLRLKGEILEEVAGLVEAMREACVRIAPHRPGIVDLCGTGGDGSGTFNISTAAALVVAGAGTPVAKHGNRSASSRCGSADVLEALGVPIELPPERACRAIEEIGFAFLFAPAYHPAMRHVAPVRRELGLRTVFNILGPMTNPAGVRRQLVGVFDDAARAMVAGVLGALESERVWAVHGEGGLDEVSLAGPTRVSVVDAGGARELEIVPEDAGLERAPLESLAGGDAAANAATIERVLAGESGPRRDAVIVNAAAALIVAGRAEALDEGAVLAAEAIDSGGARRVLEELRRFA